MNDNISNSHYHVSPFLKTITSHPTHTLSRSDAQLARWYAIIVLHRRHLAKVRRSVSTIDFTHWLQLVQHLWIIKEAGLDYNNRSIYFSIHPDHSKALDAAMIDDSIATVTSTCSCGYVSPRELAELFPVSNAPGPWSAIARCSYPSASSLIGCRSTSYTECNCTRSSDDSLGNVNSQSLHLTHHIVIISMVLECIITAHTRAFGRRHLGWKSNVQCSGNVV